MKPADWLNLINRSTLGAEYKNWARRLDPGYYPAQAEGIIGFQFWIRRLDDHEAGEIAMELAKFCSEAGFGGEWLHNTFTTTPPGPRGAGMLIFFSLALFERENNHGIAALLEWEKSPHYPANQKFAWQLYQRMVEAEMISIPGKFVTSSDRQRYQLICDTIHKALKSDYQSVITLVQDIIELEKLEKLAKHEGKTKSLAHAPRSA